MGIFWSKKKIYWVPPHRKLEDLLEDSSKWKQTMDMTGWQLQNSLHDKLGDAMSSVKTTVEVNLSYNGIGDDECEQLARVIKQSKTVKRLILENNHIHMKGAQALAAALTPETGKDDPPLEELNLKNNGIGSEGATAIAQVLTSNKNLKKVNLYWNNIGNSGLQAICQNLRNDFPKDFVLDLRYNGFDRTDTSVNWIEMENKIRSSHLCLTVNGVGPKLLGWPPF
mmetsp:Transcript_10074/g.22974  ORF Transcript_10074/g.22974 Transcript_10074/m.22974 type:complete len:225 (-) Transcript_10074:2093-2767(-)